MNEKFTPGEWKIEERQSRFGDMELYGFAILTETKRICMCQTDDGRDIPQMKANASLIAAAPEMYRLLQQLHGSLQSVPILQAEIEKVLKKARGEDE